MAEQQGQKQVLSSDQEQSPIRAKDERPPTRKRLTLWEFLNSQLALWLLGSVVLSGISYYWNYRQQAIDRQREDSQFLGTMIPFLTNSDIWVRLRAVDVISTRYPDGQLPPKVAGLIANVLRDATSAPGRSNQTDETNSLVARVARTLDKQSPADADVTATVQQLPARIYLQIFGEAERANAKKIQDLLRARGLLVPGIENVAGKKPQPVKETQVRYFNDSDEPTAELVRDTLVHNGFPQATVEPKSSLKANPGTIEVWFASSS